MVRDAAVAIPVDSNGDAAMKKNTAMVGHRTLASDACLTQIAERHPMMEIDTVKVAQRLRRTAALIADGVAYQLGRYDLSEGRFAVLMMLYHHPDGELQPGVMADRLAVTRANISGLLDGLERDGLIVRRSHSDDRRRVEVRVTDKAIDLLDRVVPGHFGVLTDLMAGLSADERAVLITLLDKIAERAGAREAASPSASPAAVDRLASIA